VRKMTNRGELDFHRLQASSTAEQAVLLDESGGDGFEAARLYESSAKHLTSLLESTGTYMKSR
jgi:hypothetical protein